MSAGPWDILTGDAERDRRNVSILMESVEALYGTEDPGALLERALDRAITVMGAERGFLLLEQPGAGLEVVVARDRAGRPLPLGERISRTVVEQVWRTGEPSLTMDTAHPATHSLSESILALRLLSLMAVPLRARARRLGVLYVDSTARAREFTKGDLAVFKALGGIIGLSVEGARLMEERAEKERLLRERQVARQVQQGLLPKALPVLEGFDLAALGRPCDETSGDYYDVIPLAEGRLALAVGDVSGHGLGPALLMASTRALLHVLLRVQPDLVRVMTELNEQLARDMPDNAFVSLFVARLDPAAAVLEYVSAGHNPPLLARADGRIEELPRTGAVLGVTTALGFEASAAWRLAPGDALMLYTDGLYEAQDAAGRMYGEERLKASLQRHADGARSAGEVLDGVVGDLLAHTQEVPLADDLTCLVLLARP